MSRTIVLDSSPLSLLTQRHGIPVADQCRQWVANRITAGSVVIVPEIIDYELRRELIRAGKTDSVARLDAFISDPLVTYRPLDTTAMRMAAELWAVARNQGRPTASDRALDIDVILAAQALSLGVPTTDLVIATTNIGHLSQYAPAEVWPNIHS